ncbi:MAG: HAMP domain-containing histidine kinase [Dysgonamonadaceae bacterium]|jgi:signal transduction histidine kinase|nr:HAMP domain-containing histidine kinase [Dysgonamonadaceae bacterium]
MKRNLFKNWKSYKYRQWAFFYLFAIFILFAFLEISFILNREKMLKMERLKSNQEIYTTIIDEYIIKNQLQKEKLNILDSLLFFLPDNMHFTIMDEEGNILYDNVLGDKKKVENQKKKVEIIKASIKGDGWSVRNSTLTNSKYMFYAIYKNGYIIRTALPFSKEIENSLKPDTVFFLFILFLFVFVFFFHLSIYFLFRKSIYKLKNFVLSFRNNKPFPNMISLPDGELREIQTEIVNVFEQLERKEKDALLEREKLLEHFHFSEEGISFFTPFFENIYTNSHFIQYLNIILNEPTINVKTLFQNPIFNEILQFLKNQGNRNVFAHKLHANGCHFFVRAIIFDDKSFEIIIRDISETEKNHIDRAEMTNNIAHELRTPVTSVRGYLETLKERENMSPEKKKEYVERAYKQIIRLSQIIQDVILLTKTNDAPQYFSIEPVNIREMLKEMIEVDTKEDILKHNCTVNLLVSENVIVIGNHTLLYSIFFNLYTNALKYAGENITITIHNYMEDDEYYYFSFSDNGKGIEEKYLDHIFERFYRITEGRTRDKGGSGLGLSIVKEAVNFHKGIILAKNRSQGGLEFLFTIKKK